MAVLGRELEEQRVVVAELEDAIRHFAQARADGEDQALSRATDLEHDLALIKAELEAGRLHEARRAQEVSKTATQHSTTTQGPTPPPCFLLYSLPMYCSLITPFCLLLPIFSDPDLFA